MSLSRYYQLLPDSLRDKIRKKLGPYSPKPYVLKDSINRIDKFPSGNGGGVIFTADFELAWAVRYSRRKIDPLEYARIERGNVPLILKVCEAYDMPVTWATVGHLFLDSCGKDDHEWMHRLPYFEDHWSYTEGDWFDHDPHTNLESDPEWYAPDLIKQILESKIKHEIGCHSFSHIDCSDTHCPPAVINDELTACESAAKDWGIVFRSMAFPGGTAGNFAVLKEHGIKIYRRRVGVYELGYPFRDEMGLLVSPTGPPIGKVRDGWSVDEEFVRYRKAIDKAIKHRSLVHFWFHPSAHPSAFKQLMPKIFSYCADRRESGQLWVGTMNGIQEHINSRNIL